MLPVTIARQFATVAVSIALAVSARPPSHTGATHVTATLAALSPPAESVMRAMHFAAQFSGVDATHEKLVWHGHISGAQSENVTLTVEPLYTPMASAEPVWPIRVRWSEPGAGTKPVSVADLEGIVDWKTNRMHVDGTVVEGTAKGRQVTLHATFRDLDPVGVLSIVNDRILADRGNAAPAP